MKYNPTHRIKILQGSYRIANENGVLNQFIFYYQLKQLKVDGFYKRGELQRFSDVLGRSTGDISRNLTKLANVGFIRKVKGGYQLIKYDELWEKLGFDLSDKENYKIIKVASNLDFKWELFSKEIEISLKNQEVKAINNHVYREAKKNPDTELMPEGLKRKLAKKFSHKIALRRQLLEIRKTLNFPEINYDVTLSCFGVAKLFGYTSKMQGHKIEKELDRRGLLKVINRPALYISDAIGQVEFKYLKEENPNHPIISKLFMTGRGKVMMHRPNLIEVDFECKEKHFIQNVYKPNAHDNGSLVTDSKEIEYINNKDKNTRDIRDTKYNSILYSSSTNDITSKLLGKVSIKDYLCSNQNKGYNTNIGNESKSVKRKADQYYINPLTLREGKLYSNA